MLLVSCGITKEAAQRRNTETPEVLYLLRTTSLPLLFTFSSFFSFLIFFSLGCFFSHNPTFSCYSLLPSILLHLLRLQSAASSSVVAAVSCVWLSSWKRGGCSGGFLWVGLQSCSQDQDKQEEEEVVEDGGGSGWSVGAGEECLQAERPAHPVCAGRSHWLPAGLLPQRQAALWAGQLVKTRGADCDPPPILPTCTCTCPHAVPP